MKRIKEKKGKDAMEKKEMVYTDDEKIDAEDIAGEVKKMNDKEKWKLYFMLRGANILTEGEPEEEGKETDQEAAAM